MKKPHLIKLNHKVQVIDLGYTRARRRHRQQRGRLSAAPATQIPAALQQRELCSTSKPLGKKQAMAPFLIGDAGPTGSSAFNNSRGSTCSCLAFTAIKSLRSPLDGLSAILLVDGTLVNREKLGCKHTATMLWALWCWVVWAGGATIFQETCYDTLKHMLV